MVAKTLNWLAQLYTHTSEAEIFSFLRPAVNLPDSSIISFQVGIDECLYENQMCEGSCTNTLDISALPYMVSIN